MTERGGVGSAIAALLLRGRVFILLATLAATALSLFLISRATPEPGIESFLRAALLPVLAWACGVYALLLSLRLTLIALVAPLMAGAWWAAIGAGGFWAVTQGFVFPSFLAIAIAGALLAVLHLQAMAAEIAHGADAGKAARTVLGRIILPAVLVMLAACAGIAALAFPDFGNAPAIGVGALLMLMASFLLPPLVTSFLAFNESFIARANRARERREWLISYFAMLTVPRWAFATAGIAAVLSSLVYFDSAFAGLWQGAMKPYGIAFAAIGVFAAIGLRNWRAFFSCGLPPLLASLIGAWAVARFGFSSRDASELSLLLGSSVGAGFVYFLAAPTAYYQRSGDPMLIAFSHALNETGAAVCILAIGLALAMLAGAVMMNITPAIALLPLCHIAGALVLFPALAAALDDLFPRRRPLKELYRAR